MRQLVATAWSSAGDTSPMRTPATSPVPIGERITAIADAGFCGFGLIADDLVAVRDSIGFERLRDLAAQAGLVHTEIELLERWWTPRGEPGHTHDVRDLLFEAADVLAPVFIKIGSENGPPTDNPTALAAPLRELALLPAAHPPGRDRDHAVLGHRHRADGRRNRGRRRPSRGGAARRRLARVPGRHHAGRTPRRVATEHDLRRRAGRRSTRCRRHSLRGHRTAPVVLRRGLLRPDRPGSGAARTRFRRAMGRGDPGRRRTGRCRSTRRSSSPRSQR